MSLNNTLTSKEMRLIAAGMGGNNKLRLGRQKFAPVLRVPTPLVTPAIFPVP